MQSSFLDYEDHVVFLNLDSGSSSNGFTLAISKLEPPKRTFGVVCSSRSVARQVPGLASAKLASNCASWCYHPDWKARKIPSGQSMAR